MIFQVNKKRGFFSLALVLAITAFAVCDGVFAQDLDQDANAPVKIRGKTVRYPNSKWCPLECLASKAAIESLNDVGLVAGATCTDYSDYNVFRSEFRVRPEQFGQTFSNEIEIAYKGPCNVSGLDVCRTATLQFSDLSNEQVTAFANCEKLANGNGKLKVQVRFTK